MTGQAGRHHRPERLDEPVVDAADDVVARQQVRDRLPHAELLRRPDLQVQDEVADHRRLALVHDDPVLVLQRPELGRRERLERHVDRLALERELHRRRARVVLDDQVRRLRLVLAPVARPLAEDGLLARLEPDQLVRSGADLGARVRPDLGERVRALRDDLAGARREDLRPGRLRALQMEDHAELPLGRDALHVLEQRVDPRRVVDLLHALERPDDVRGRHVLAVVELDPLAELADERPQVALEPALGREHGMRRQATWARFEQVLEDLVVDGARAEVVVAGRVDVHDRVSRAVDQGGARCGVRRHVPGREPGASA